LGRSDPAHPLDVTGGRVADEPVEAAQDPVADRPVKTPDVALGGTREFNAPALGRVSPPLGVQLGVELLQADRLATRHGLQRLLDRRLLLLRSGGLIIQ
jgi:hypothetical protein